MTKIKPDLIINSENATYHLHLTAEDICPIVITAGDPGRVNLIANELDYLEKNITQREFHSVVGTLGRKQVLIISTGIGPDNIDIVMNELHELWSQAVNRGILSDEGLKIIRLGTSGSIHPDHPLDSILISANSVGLDNVPRFYLSQNNYYPEPNTSLPYYTAKAPGKLWESFAQMPSAKTGITLTSPGFYGPQFRLVHMKPAWSLDQIRSFFEERNIQLSNIEMETAALYFFAAELGHQAVSINALLADRLTNRFSDSPGLVVRNMIRAAMKIIREL